MRTQLADWQLKVNDKGLIDEYNLLQLFWPGLIQPLTDKVAISVEKDIVARSKRIGYKISDAVDHTL
jgi:hypothetical protein